MIEGEELDDFKPLSIEANALNEGKYTVKILDKKELTKDLMNRLALWEKLKSNYILKFYGIFDENVFSKAVIEKTELGTLNEVYSENYIPWPTKVN